MLNKEDIAESVIIGLVEFCLTNDGEMFYKSKDDSWKKVEEVELKELLPLFTKYTRKDNKINN